MLDSCKMLQKVWRNPYVSLAFFPSLKHNFIAYRSSKVCSRPDCSFEIHQLWKSGFSRVYSNCCCSYSFEPEIINIGLSSHKMCSNNIQKFQESTTILHAVQKSLETYWRHHVCSWNIIKGINTCAVSSLGIRNSFWRKEVNEID